MSTAVIVDLGDYLELRIRTADTDSTDQGRLVATAKPWGGIGWRIRERDLSGSVWRDDKVAAWAVLVGLGEQHTAGA